MALFLFVPLTPLLLLALICFMIFRPTSIWGALAVAFWVAVLLIGTGMTAMLATGGYGATPAIASLILLVLPPLVILACLRHRMRLPAAHRQPSFNGDLSEPLDDPLPVWQRF